MGNSIKNLSWVIVLFLGFITSFTAFAEDDEDLYNTLNNEQKLKLVKIKIGIDTINDLEKRKILSSELALEQKQRLLITAQKILGKKIEEKAIINVFEKAKDKVVKSEIGWWDKFTSFFTLVNILIVVGAIFIVIGLVYVLLVHFIDFIIAIPKEFWEFSFYTVSITTIWYAKSLSTHTAPYVALLGVFGLLWSVIFSHIVHDSIVELYGENFNFALSLNAFVISIIWGIIAVIFSSPLIGFISVLPLSLAIGLSIIIKPFQLLLGGSESDPVLPRIIGTAFLMLSAYVIVELLKLEIPSYNVFASGLLYIGGLGYFIASLVLVSKWYVNTEETRFWGLQGFALVSSVAWMMLGAHLDISTLQQLGGPFIVLYLIEKFIELIDFSKHWGWGLLGLGIILYGTTLVIKAYPAYFLFAM